jgi:hypothetical protein
MLLFYIDEVGNEKLDDASLEAHPWFVLGSMCIKDTSRLSLKEHLYRIKDRFFAGWQGLAWGDSEIKGRYLAAAAGRANRGRSPLEPRCYRALTSTKVRALVTTLFSTIDRFRPTFYFVAINKAELLRRWPATAFSPVGIGYAFVQMRAALLVELVYGSDEGAMFIADQQTAHEKLFRLGEIQRIREQLASHVERPANMQLVIDKPTWVNKGELEVERENCQLLDVALYVVARAAATGSWRDPWLGRIAPHLARHWTKGTVWDAGIGIYPRPEPRYPRFPF